MFFWWFDVVFLDLLFHNNILNYFLKDFFTPCRQLCRKLILPIGMKKNLEWIKTQLKLMTWNSFENLFLLKKLFYLPFETIAFFEIFFLFNISIVISLQILHWKLRFISTFGFIFLSKALGGIGQIWSKILSN